MGKGFPLSLFLAWMGSPLSSAMLMETRPEIGGSKYYPCTDMLAKTEDVFLRLPNKLVGHFLLSIHPWSILQEIWGTV
jgi:hypothetical protein